MRRRWLNSLGDVGGREAQDEAEGLAGLARLLHDIGPFPGHDARPDAGAALGTGRDAVLELDGLAFADAGHTLVLAVTTRRRAVGARGGRDSSRCGSGARRRRCRRFWRCWRRRWRRGYRRGTAAALGGRSGAARTAGEKETSKSDDRGSLHVGVPITAGDHLPGVVAGAQVG